MSDDERCPKYPSILKAYCSHCQGTDRGTADNPRYSLRKFRYLGNPMVEVLANGGPAVPWDKNFQFGLRKAQMLLACASLLRDFWRSNDEQRCAFETRLVHKEIGNLTVRVYVEMQPCFEHSSGLMVDRPYLQLQSLSPHREDIGLGAMKCRAICEVEEALKQWLKSCKIAV